MRVAPRGGRTRSTPVAWLLAFVLAAACWMGAIHAQPVHYIYDELGRLVAVVDPAGETVVYSYDEVGNLLSVSRNSSSQVKVVSFTPTRGQVGDTVTVFGSGFSPNPAQNTVSINGTPATVTASTATSIVATVPVAATTGTISVTTPQGSASSAAAFTVFAPQPPQIASFTPLVAAPGGVVTIHGVGFEPVPAENLARINTSTSAVLAATDISLTNRVPSATGGKISLTTQYGSATSAEDLFIVPPPNAVADVGATTRVTLDGPGSVLALPASKIGLALFDGVAGTVGARVSARDVTLPSGGTMTVHRPDGSALVSSTGFGTAGTTVTLPTLPATGTYGVRVTPASGSGNVTLSAWTDISGTATPDTSVDLTFTNPGQVARFTFTAAAGDNLGVDLSNVTLPAGGTLLVVRNSDGAQFLNQTFATGTAGASFRIPTSSTAGTYTIVVTPASSGTGSVRMTLWRDVAGTLNLGELTDITVPFRNQFVRMGFTAQANQNLGIDLSGLVGISSGTLLVIRDSDGTQFVNQSFTTTAGLGARIPASSQAGSYTVIVTPASNSTGTFKLRLWKDVDDALTVGTPHALSILYRNQAARLPYTAAAGENIGIDLSNITLPAGGTLLVIRNSDGAQFLNQTFATGTAGASFRIPASSQAGSYTVIVTPSSSGTGSLDLILWKDVDDALTIDSPYALSIPYRNQFARLPFTAASGDSLGIELSNVTLPAGGTLTVVRNSDGTQFVNTSFGTAGGTFNIPTLAVAGAYTVHIAPNSAGTGSMTVRVFHR